jgi:hypothetical protein
MKKLALLLLATGLSLSIKAITPGNENIKLPLYTIAAAEESEPGTTLENTVRTYIENYLEGDFEEMTTVLHENFTNQGLSHDGKLGERQNAEDLKRIMHGQIQIAPESQENIITVTGIKDNVATVLLETGTDVARWDEYITLEKNNGKWKVKKIFWSFK